MIGTHLDLHRCLFNEIDLETDTEIVHSDFARTGESVAGTHRLSDYSTATSELMMSGDTVVNHDSKRDPRTADRYSTTYGPNNERAYVTVPMMRNGKWSGSLWCSDDKPRRWTGREIALLGSIAERVWSGVARLRADHALRESEKVPHDLRIYRRRFVIVEMIVDDQGRAIDYRFPRSQPGVCSPDRASI